METKTWSKDVSFPSKETLGNFWVWCNKGHFILILDLQHLQISQQHLPLNLWVTRKPHLHWATLRQKELMHYAPGCSYSPHFNSVPKCWVDIIPVPKWNMVKHHKLQMFFFVCWCTLKNFEYQIRGVSTSWPLSFSKKGLQAQVADGKNQSI